MPLRPSTGARLDTIRKQPTISTTSLYDSARWKRLVLTGPVSYPNSPWPPPGLAPRASRLAPRGSIAGAVICARCEATSAACWSIATWLLEAPETDWRPAAYRLAHFHKAFRPRHRGRPRPRQSRPPGTSREGTFPSTNSSATSARSSVRLKRSELSATDSFNSASPPPRSKAA